MAGSRTDIAMLRPLQLVNDVKSPVNEKFGSGNAESTGFMEVDPAAASPTLDRTGSSDFRRRREDE